MNLSVCVIARIGWRNIQSKDENLVTRISGTRHIFTSKNNNELYFNFAKFIQNCRCTFRFPSTAIKLVFQSLVEEEPDPLPEHRNNGSKSSNRNQKENLKSFAPLKVNIPDASDVDFASPVASPTGTLSAANSCPTSPRPGARHRNNDLQLMVAYAAAAVASGEHGDHHGHGHHGSSRRKEPKGHGHSASHDGNNDYYGGSVTVGDGRGSGANSPAGDVDDSKPPFSYAQLIVQSIASAPDRQLTLSGIYSYITKNYPYYRTAEKGWQVS